MNLSTLLLGISFLTLNFPPASKTADLAAFEVIEKRTEYNGIYYSYAIKNVGTATIPSDSYKVLLKVNGKTASFDKATSEIKPGQTIVYHAQKTFYQKNEDKLNYSLEIKFSDSNLANNTLTGESIF